MEIDVSENLRPGASYSTVFQANKSTFGLFIPREKRFSFGLLARTEVVMTGFYARDKNQYRVEWAVGSSRGASNPAIDTPQVYEAVNEIGKKVEEANRGLSLSGLTTWLLTPNISLPKGLSDLAESGINKVGGAVQFAFGQITTPVFLIGGIVAIGLAVGLSKSRANLSR